jgi:hypothetical protein
MPPRTHTLRWEGMATKPTLVFAAGMFVLTTVLFAAAMVVAHELSIPEPAKRFLPSVARDLPGASASEQPDDLTFANDVQPGAARTRDEPVATVTAVPEPPATTRAVSSGGAEDTSATATDSAGRPRAASPQATPTPPWWAFDPPPNRNPSRSPSPSPTPHEPTPEPTPGPTPGWESEPPDSEPTPAPPPASEPAPAPPPASEPPASEAQESEPAPSQSALPQASEGATESPTAR